MFLSILPANILQNCRNAAFQTIKNDMMQMLKQVHQELEKACSEEVWV